ncbi:hypothetical protein [Pararhizobium qamdonense]|uniref:hypothetical protein n=1 Tax=Pararhizobium qamdonense TaxID=3031126 RepID=UPI0023E1A24B|nr:hypothetical protein [Pararhizobium qamdonense]
MSKFTFHGRAFLAALIRFVIFLALVLFAAVALSGVIVVGLPLVILIGVVLALTALGSRVDPRWRRPF